MIFAFMMAITRVIYGNFTNKISLDNLIIISSVLCVAAYLMAALTTSPVIGLIGVALSGVSVGILWPGTYSCASSSIRSGGTAMFAILALGGDIGASAGPTLVGLISSVFNDNLKMGILFAVVFPAVLFVCMMISKNIKKKSKVENMLSEQNPVFH